jgi:hypothetical protein
MNNIQQSSCNAMNSQRRLFRRHFLLAALLAGNILHAQSPNLVKSPDGRLAVEFKLNANGSPVYQIIRDSQPVLRESRLGLTRDDADFSQGLVLTGESKITKVSDRYEILTAKRRLNDYRANRKEFHLATADGKKMDIIFQVSDDGVAFRYFFPDAATNICSLKEEVSSFHFQPDAKAWLQPMQVAKTGYGSSNPAYEEFYSKGIPVGTPSTLGAGWVYPALFQSGETWVAITEASLGRNYCATRLRDQSPDGEYSVGFPDPRETIDGQPVNPSSSLPWLTPWRVITIGSLKTIAESTLGTDLADKSALPLASWIKPGKAAWSWPLLGDRSANFDTQKKFIDYASGMGWSYCLIDAWWDRQIGYDKMKELADYARTKNVGLLLWYNSAGGWNTVKQTPRDKLLTHESRVQEFSRLQAMGIKGIKIDFFGGDGQPMIDYYHDILDDAVPFKLLLDFHGATTPRGWGRTYPQLMSMEAIRGFEYITFQQTNADEEPSHATMLPFTRNLFDPMDFTPVCLNKIGKTKLQTTHAFELALSVIFISGIQHYVDTPEGMAKMPDYVKDYMKQVPSVWDDTKFVDGFPGKLAVLARKGDGHWYLAGINGEPVEKKLTLDLSALSGAKAGQLVTDGDGDQLFTKQDVRLGADKKIEVTLKPNGGFVIVF